MCVNIIYVCICLYCVICLILYYRSLLICTNKEFMNYHSVNLLKGKGKNFWPVIDGHSTNKDIADCFAESYKTVLLKLL